MWVFLSDSFLSIVDKGDPSGKTLLVRARRNGDIERAFPNAEVVIGRGTDYRYRARIDRSMVAKKLADSVLELDYENFKNTVMEHDRHDTYLQVWRAMFSYQSAERISK
jgi:hypothetical protein